MKYSLTSIDKHSNKQCNKYFIHCAVKAKARATQIVGLHQAKWTLFAAKDFRWSVLLYPRGFVFIDLPLFCVIRFWFLPRQHSPLFSIWRSLGMLSWESCLDFYFDSLLVLCHNILKVIHPLHCYSPSVFFWSTPIVVNYTYRVRVINGSIIFPALLQNDCPIEDVISSLMLCLKPAYTSCHTFSNYLLNQWRLRKVFW